MELKRDHLFITLLCSGAFPDPVPTLVRVKNYFVLPPLGTSKIFENHLPPNEFFSTQENEFLLNFFFGKNSFCKSEKIFFCLPQLLVLEDNTAKSILFS